MIRSSVRICLLYTSAVEPDELRAFGDKLDVRIRDLTEQIYHDADGEFNINSPKQLGEVLFEKLGLHAPKKTKTGYSTNVEVLELSLIHL